MASLPPAALDPEPGPEGGEDSQDDDDMEEVI